MNQTEFVGSLTPDQTAAFNAVLIAQRDQLKAMYDSAESGLVVAQAGITTNLTTEKTALQDRLGQSEIDKTEASTAKQGELDAMKTAHDAVVSQLAIDKDTQSNQAKDVADTRFDAAQATHTEAVRVLDAEITQLKADSSSTNATVASLTERLSRLLVELPFNPRVIDADAFLLRITTEETFQLFSSDDPNCQGIAALLKDYKRNDYPIILDDPQVIGALSYLEAIGLIPIDRAKQIVRDATRAEAYTAD